MSIITAFVDVVIGAGEYFMAGHVPLPPTEKKLSIHTPLWPNNNTQEHKLALFKTADRFDG